MGRNAASVLPAAVAAAMIRSWDVVRSEVIARSWMGRNALHSLRQIHSLTSSSRSSNAGDSDLEGGELIIGTRGIGFVDVEWLQIGVSLSLQIDLVDQVAPLDLGVLLHRHQQADERLDAAAWGAEVRVADLLGAVRHECLDPVVGNEVLTLITRGL